MGQQTRSAHKVLKQYRSECFLCQYLYQINVLLTAQISSKTLPLPVSKRALLIFLQSSNDDDKGTVSVLGLTQCLEPNVNESLQVALLYQPCVYIQGIAK